MARVSLPECVSVRSDARRTQAAISSQCGSCAAKDEDIEQLRVGMKGVEEQAEVSTCSVSTMSRC